MNAESIIEINGLSKDYETGFWRKKRVRALDDLSLSVPRGVIFGFLGGNGAGKTTTIKTLMRLLFPTSGSATILGRPISDTSMHSRIGYCPENPYFYDYLTATELMNYFGELFGLNAAERRSRIDSLLTSVGIAEKDRHKQLRKFSKGMLQRVGLAQSLINKPEIVFLDEPMSGLDPIGRREVRELIAGLREKGTTVFMSTHILSDVEALCDEVAIMRGGRLAATGKLDALLAANSGVNSFEVRISGVSAEQARAELQVVSVQPIVGGCSLELLDERDLDGVLAVIRPLGGKILSVQPVRQSLEDLFIDQAAK